MLIQNMAEISKNKKRDVLYAKFDCPQKRGRSEGVCSWEDYKPRIDFIQWLQRNEIASTIAMFYYPGEIEKPYDGSIYIDVPVDKSNEKSKKLLSYAEHEDGSSCLPGVRLWVVNHEYALRVCKESEKFY